MALNGIDVSRYQGAIDWDQVKKAGISFAMLRGGYGQNNVDPYFHQNAAACQRLAIPFGNLPGFPMPIRTQMAAPGSRVLYCPGRAVQDHLAHCL